MLLLEEKLILSTVSQRVSSKEEELQIDQVILLHFCHVTIVAVIKMQVTYCSMIIVVGRRVQPLIEQKLKTVSSSTF
jgi:hypothetical protein